MSAVGALHERGAGHGRFVGRERELGGLRFGREEMLAGQGHFFLIGGEPGIGKTRLADELGRAAAAAGATVLWGRCWAGDGVPIFWPWAQLLRGFAAVSDSPAEDGAVDWTDSLAPLLSGGWPTPADGSGQAGAAESADLERRRFRLFDATSAFLKATARRRPLVLMLDDIHAADQASLRLLQFVTADLHSVPLLVLATYRDGEVRADPALAELIGELSRQGTHIVLGGLSAAEVGLLAAESAGRAVPAELSHALHAITDGNPFFVDEIVRLLVAEHRFDGAPERALVDLRIPAQIRDAVRLQLRPLSAAALRWLSVAAVIGREISIAALEAVYAKAAIAGFDGAVGTLHDALAEAVRLGELTPTSRLPMRYRFARALVRETLYDDLPAAQRHSLHSAVAEAFEVLHGANLEPHLAEIAHHYYLATPAGDLHKAIEYQVRAAEQAERQKSYESATLHYERAVQLCAAADAVDDLRRCNLLLALGHMQTRGTDIAAASATFMRAAELARRLAAGDALAAAALGVAAIGPGLPEGTPDPAKVRLLEDALRGLGEADSVLRVRLLGSLAVELYYAAPLSMRTAMADEALAMAKRLGDPATLAQALSDRHRALLGPGNLQERLQLAAELLTLARHVGDEDLLLRAHALRIFDLFEAADAPALDRELGQCMRHAERLRQPRHLWLAIHLRAVRAQSRGALAEAERLAGEALAVGRRAKDSAVEALSTPLMLAVRVAQGRLAEIVPDVRAYVARFADRPVAACCLAYVCAESGDFAAAQVELDRFAAGDFATLPFDDAWVTAMAYLAHVCVVLLERRHAPRLYELLLPYRQSMVSVGQPVMYCDAPVEHFLGMLAVCMGSSDAAAAHFERSLEIAAGMDALPFMLRTQVEYAQMLEARSAAGDSERAVELLAQAQGLARQLSIPLPAPRGAVRGVRQESAAESGEPLPASAAGIVAPDINAFRRDGEFWSLCYEGRSCSVKDTKGLSYLAQLLGRPGQEVHALELGRAASGHPVVDGEPTGRAAEIATLGDAGELLDPQAKAAYRRRLQELDAELEACVAANDLGRAERARAEVDFLQQELSRAVGLGGRDRRASSASERARVNVTRAIVATIRKISEQHPSLAQYLSTTIRTGTFCAYEPDPRLATRWDTRW
jgi:tetratricopeptide (TPR) repeat protein